MTTDGGRSLTDEEGLAAASRLMLDVARRALAEATTSGRSLPPQDLGRVGKAGEAAGVFVTLRISGQLRGCIGVPEPVMPMVEACWQAAQQAALEDPRFPPVEKDELAAMEVEVSVLSGFEELAWLEMFEPGRDGAVLEVAGRRSLFLPEVAAETGWEREEFFDHLAMKAGLPPEAWRLPEARILRFTTITAHGPATMPDG
jgi:AmmeMemoRadiSam system protein A